MGNDGGSIVKRDVVKTKKKDQILNKSDLDESRWFRCSLLQDQLTDPIVADDLGNLFNKENVIQALLDGALASHPSLSHIRSLRSLYDVHFAANPSYREGDKTKSRWYCPITKNEVGGHQIRFKLIKPCGHAISDRAFSIIDTNNCFICSKPFTQDDIILLNPSPEELVDIKKSLLNKKKKGTKNTKKKTITEKLPQDSTTTSSSTTSTSSNEESNASTSSETSSNNESNTSTTTTTSQPTTTTKLQKKRKETEPLTSPSSTTTTTTTTSIISAIEEANEITKKKLKESDTFSSLFSSSSNSSSIAGNGSSSGGTNK